MQQQTYKTGIVWFRNDLRVRDQEALFRACEQCETVIGVYCFDPRFFGHTQFGFPKTGRFRAKFLIESLAALRQQLALIGIPLLIRQASPEIVLPELTEASAAVSVFATKALTDEEIQAETAVQQALLPHVSLHLYHTDFMVFPADLPYPITELPEVFTAFRKSVEKRIPIRDEFPVPAHRHQATCPYEPGNIPDLKALGLDSVEADERCAFPFNGGESAAWERVKQYCWESEGLSTYKQTRNGLIGTEYSSKFSPWLANGCISPRSLWHEVKRFEQEIISNSSTYWMVFELLWRDYFRFIAMKWGNRIFQAGGIKGYVLPASPDLSVFQTWQSGETGQPFIDANTRELALTGWMSNRGRQNVASYLVKDLKQDWRMGASWFESLLLDYDPCSNWCNWIYVAGVGNDPRENRYFNPVIQAERYDPEGKFVALWDM